MEERITYQIAEVAVKTLRLEIAQLLDENEKDAVADGAQLKEESNLKTNNITREGPLTKSSTSGFCKYSFSGSGGLRYTEQHRVTKCRISKPRRSKSFL